jgi:hypothetical protein
VSRSGSVGTITARVLSGDKVIRHTDQRFYLVNEVAAHHDIDPVQTALSFLAELKAVCDAYFALHDSDELRDRARRLGRGADRGRVANDVAPAQRERLDRAAQHGRGASAKPDGPGGRGSSGTRTTRLKAHRPDDGGRRRSYAQAVRRIAFLGSLLAVLGAASSAHAAPSGWGKIGGIGVGMLQDAVVYHYGVGHRNSCADKGCADVRYYGKVQVVFEHGRVASINCAAPGSLAGRGCPFGFALPDGVALGTTVPYAKRWRGYVRYTPQEGQYDLYSWKKQVRVGGRLVGVFLTVEKSKVVSIGESVLKG